MAVLSSNVATDTVRNPELPPNTELHGWWLAAAWVAGIASVALAAVVYIAIERFAFVEVRDQQGRVVVLAVSGVQLVGFFAAAAIILWRRYNDWVALLVALVLVSLPLSFIDADEPAFLAANPGWVIPTIADSLFIGAGIPLFLLLLVFPNGTLVPRWAGALVLLWVPVVLITGLPLLSDSAALDSSLFNTVWLALVTLGVFAQVYRYRRVSGPTERQQTKWVILGLAGFVLGVSVWAIGSFALPSLTDTAGPIDAIAGTSFGALGRPVEIGAGVLMFSLPLAFPFSLMFAILRYRLWDIDVVLNRALVYGSLTAALAGTYIGSVVLLQMAFRGVTGQGNAVAIVISTLTIAALFMPLRRRIQDIIDRRFFRRRYDAALTLAAFADRMRDEVDVDRLTGELVAVVESTMQPTHASLWLRAGQAGPGRSAE